MAPAAAVRVALAAAKSALLFSSSPTSHLMLQTFSPSPSDPFSCYPGHHLSGLEGQSHPGLRGAKLCPWCWSAYLIHHVHVCQQQHQQCRGREVPASKGGRGARRGRCAIVGRAQPAAAPPLSPFRCACALAHRCRFPFATAAIPL